MENFKLSFEEPKYYVNEEKQLVTCVLNFHLLGNQKLMRLVRLMGAEFLESETCSNPFLTGFKVHYSAKPSHGDEFNVEIGKKVSRAKAESRAYRYMANLLRRMFNQYSNMYNDMYDSFYVKASSVIDHNDRYLEKF